MSARPETERRFIVYEFDRFILRAPQKHIYQGYFETPPDFERRVRIVNGSKGTLTRKDGSGLTRVEDDERVFDDVREAYAAMEETVDRLEKDRYVLDGWEFDVYGPPLLGLHVLEFEHPRAAFIRLPPWIYRAREVTGLLSNRDLARLATRRKNGETNRTVNEQVEAFLASQ